MNQVLYTAIKKLAGYKPQTIDEEAFKVELIAISWEEILGSWLAYYKMWMLTSDKTPIKSIEFDPQTGALKF